METVAYKSKFEFDGMNHNKKANLIRIAVIGEKGVGKSAFMKCSVFGSYDPYMKSAIDSEFLSREIYVNNEKVMMQLWECDGQVYDSLVIMYDITCRQSFLTATKKLEQIRRQFSSQLPIVLVGNKVDAEKKRKVLACEGELAAIQHSTLFNEVSCIKKLNVRETVVEFLQSIFLHDICSSPM